MIKRKLASLALLLVLLGSLGWQSTRAQSGGGIYFEQTGHWVKGEFLARYSSVPNPLKLYGYPIAPAFLDRSTNLLVQYFQKARFEQHPDAPPEKRIRLTPLGFYLYQPSDPVPQPESSAGCRFFLTGFYVCHAFLDFFDANGGEAQFGLPVSAQELRDGRIVQHFLNARFEWHPEYPLGERVILANLGYDQFFTRQEDPRLLAPEPENNAPGGILSLKVRAYPLEAVTSRAGQQTIFIIVQDQKLVPVEGAQVTLAVKIPGVQEALYIVNELTNAKGITRFSFNFSSDQVGLVEIGVKATQDGLQAKTTTSFRLWW